MTAAERFKWILANALERNCVLEATLETAQARIAELEASAPKPRAKRATKKT